MEKRQKAQLHAAAPDFLRVISIAIVAWYHFWQQSWLNPNFELFGYTVDIYPIIRCGYMFVYNLILISGFVLMLNRLNGRYSSAWTFYRSRAVRILPSYLFCILVFLFISSQPGGTYDWTGGKAHMRLDLISHLTFTHTFFPQSYNGTGLNVALWTIAVEVQFYLLFPVLSAWFAKKPLATYTGMCLASLAYRLYVCLFISESTMYINQLPAMLDVFANGMLSAYFYFKLKNRKQVPVIHFLLSIASLIGMYFIVRDISYVKSGEPQRMAQMWGSSFLSVFSAVFLISGSLCGKVVRLLLSNTLIQRISGLTYNFYIWHQPIAVWLKKLHIPDYTEEYPNIAGNIRWQHTYMLFCIICALFAAVRTTYLIEKPCAQWLNAHRISDLKALIKKRNMCSSPSKEENRSA